MMMMMVMRRRRRKRKRMSESQDLGDVLSLCAGQFYFIFLDVT